MDHDQLFKELLHAVFIDFLELFLPNVLKYLDVNSIEFVEQESFSEITERDKRSVDLLIKARFKGRLTYFLIHIEVQARKKGWSPRRMFYYFAAQTYKHELPVYPIAILSWDSPREAAPDQYVVEFPDRRVLEFNYVAIQLNRFDWRKFLKRDNAAASALMAKMGVSPEDRPRVRAACVGMLVRLKLPRNKWHPVMRFIDAYLPLTPRQEREFEQEIKQFKPRERSVAMEYITSWERKGIEIGKLEGKLELVLRQLPKRTGELSAAMRKRVSKLSAAQLDLLGDALIDFQRKADLSKWLKENLNRGGSHERRTARQNGRIHSGATGKTK